MKIKSGVKSEDLEEGKIWKKKKRNTDYDFPPHTQINL